MKITNQFHDGPISGSGVFYIWKLQRRKINNKKWIIIWTCFHGGAQKKLIITVIVRHTSDYSAFRNNCSTPLLKNFLEHHAILIRWNIFHLFHHPLKRWWLIIFIYIAVIFIRQKPVVVYVLSLELNVSFFWF